HKAKEHMAVAGERKYGGDYMDDLRFYCFWFLVVIAKAYECWHDHRPQHFAYKALGVAKEITMLVSCNCYSNGNGGGLIVMVIMRLRW
ncbi:unnamed protein product, partial [Ilex paraguariensis]